MLCCNITNYILKYYEIYVVENLVSLKITIILLSILINIRHITYAPIIFPKEGRYGKKKDPIVKWLRLNIFTVKCAGSIPVWA